MKSTKRKKPKLKKAGIYRPHDDLLGLHHLKHLQSVKIIVPTEGAKGALAFLLKTAPQLRNLRIIPKGNEYALIKRDLTYHDTAKINIM